MKAAETRACQNCKTDFTIESDDFGFYEKLQVLPPAWCPRCRMQRRMVWRNERTLYKRICALCNKSMVTMYHPNAPYIVYCNDCWFSDAWDPYSYALDYDRSRPFFEQLQKLIKTVPKFALYITNASGPNINSEYTNFVGGLKDCYLIFNGGPENENCAYSRGIVKSRDVFDVYFGQSIERIYEGVNIQKSSGLAWCQNSVDCLNSWFLLNCSNCQNCFGCVNLRNKSYCFFNEQLTKAEWEKRVHEIVGRYAEIEKIKERFAQHILRYPRRENNNFKSINSKGNYIFESNNCRDCFEVGSSENCRYSFSSKFVKDSYDLVGYGRNSELLLECAGVGLSSRVLGSWAVDDSQSIAYSLAVRASKDCVGCDGIKNGDHCILNKRYSKEEYESLRDHIVGELKSAGEYGAFFPPALALFAYNETIAQENFPCAKEDVLKAGYRWEEDIPRVLDKGTLPISQIPDHINDVSEAILDEILTCGSCNRNYRLIRAEVEMYKRALIPIPRRCFECRYLDRIAKRGPFTLHTRTCAKCDKDIQTSYAPDRPEIVYCEQCYQAEVA